MIVLITGVCGFIGSHLAKRMVGDGNSVIGVDNLCNGDIRNIESIIDSETFTFCKVDILEKQCLENIFKTYNIDKIIHLAALPRISFSYNYPKETYAVNVIGTDILLNLSVDYGVERFIFASSSSIYGEQEVYPLAENLKANPSSPYSCQKLEGEKLCRDFYLKYNLKTTSLRFFNVYGSSVFNYNSYLTIIPKLIYEFKNDYKSVIKGGGEQTRDFTYIDDIVDGIVASNNIDCCLGGAINLGAGNDVSINLISKLISEKLGDNHTIIHKEYEFTEMNKTLADISKANRYLAWSPKIRIEEGLLLTINELNKKELSKIVFGIALKNGAETIRRTIKSIVEQKNVSRDIVILIVNDNSDDNWRNEIDDLLKLHNIIIKEVDCGAAHLVRNYINKYVRDCMYNVEYIARLDSDDYLVDDNVVFNLEKIMNNESPDVIILGNKLSLKNKLLERKNYATKELKDIEYLKDRLAMMNRGVTEAELPSCNVIIKKDVGLMYPSVDSAEDHWFTVKLLLDKSYDVYIDEHMLYCVYSLSGEATSINRMSDAYRKSRKALHQYILNYKSN